MRNSFIKLTALRTINMARILTGIQSSGKPHIGNILGAIGPALQQSNARDDASFFFIANLHSLTSIRNAAEIKENTLHVAATWLACGLNTEKDVFYRQSQIPEVCELAWYLSCYTPFPMLANAHSFKEKSAQLSEVNAGLFTYPVLMAADILLYDATDVPVGKDQKQHLEMTRDIAGVFNRMHGEVFVIPEANIQEEVMTVPGTDGRKMSKSYNNYINIFENEKALKKKINSIVTDSTPVEAPKDPETCHVFAIYQLVATPNEIADMRQRYIAGNFGYGDAKKMLLGVLLEKYHEARQLFLEYIQQPELIEQKLAEGEAKARDIANAVLDRVRQAIGVR